MVTEKEYYSLNHKKEANPEIDVSNMSERQINDTFSSEGIFKEMIPGGTLPAYDVVVFNKDGKEKQIQRNTVKAFYKKIEEFTQLEPTAAAEAEAAAEPAAAEPAAAEAISKFKKTERSYREKDIF
jgi:hypothetical protein